jgi:hypothetical protein
VILYTCIQLFLFCRVIYSVSATNGGFVKVQNRDRVPTYKDTTYFYSGKTTTRDFEYHWDLITPYHCSVASGMSCPAFLSIESDITSSVSDNQFECFFIPVFARHKGARAHVGGRFGRRSRLVAAHFALY